MREDEFERSVDMGHDNAQAIELTRNHCRHARIEEVHGNSLVGDALGIPMGLMEIRCEHAPPPRAQGHRVLQLAIEFYNENCVDCVFREGNGQLPNLATKAAQWAEEQERLAESQRQHAADLARRHRERTQRRHEFVAGENYVVRELVDHLDRLDRAGPPPVDESPEERRSARHVIETARAAPALFSPVLVDTILELATDKADPTALVTLRELVRAGQCQPRRAAEAALEALHRFRSPTAGDLLAFLQSEITGNDLPGVVDMLVDLASEQDYGVWRRAAAPAGLVAAAEIDLTLVTERISQGLADDDEGTRHQAADAAGVLLRVDPARVVGLGMPLVASIRGEDIGYAGYAHPSRAAVSALAAAWAGDPAATRAIIEAGAAGASEAVRGELARVPWVFERAQRTSGTADVAASEAIDFLVRRAGGDWGDEAADNAVHTLEYAARYEAAIVAHVDALVGHVLTLCAPLPATPIQPARNVMEQQIAAMETMSKQIRRDARRRDLAKTVGRSAAFDAPKVLGAVLPFFEGSSQSEDLDRCVRTTMLDALEEAVSAETIRDVLPVLYSALLSSDNTVRSAGIDLWVAAARVVHSLPDELADLSQVLLADQFVVVHRRMLHQLPRLRLPERLAPVLYPIVVGWIHTYKDSNPDVLEDAIWALRSLVGQLRDETVAQRCEEYALSNVRQCRPQDREHLLMARWPEGLRRSQTWVSAALETASNPELVDHYNQRREPVLAALFDDPDLIAQMPIEEIEPLSQVHGPRFVWRALEPVELLQSAGRWTDAVRVAAQVESTQPAGPEGDPGRLLAGFIVGGAELSRTLADGEGSTAVLAALKALRRAIGELESSRGGVDSGGPLRDLLDSMASQANAIEVLHEAVISDPETSARDLDAAADLLANTSEPVHASGKQRLWVAESWRIAGLLMRYDERTRKADAAASGFLEAAKRRAEILAATIAADRLTSVTPGLSDFLDATRTAASAADAETAWRFLGNASAPVCLVGAGLLPRWTPFRPPAAEPEVPEPPLAICVPTIKSVPVTDVLVVRPQEVYSLGLMVHLIEVPGWAETCVVEPVTALSRTAMTLPRFEFSLPELRDRPDGATLFAEAPLHCDLEQPIRDPAIDCPLIVRLLGSGRDEVVEVAGCTRIRLRPFDPSRDGFTEHEQTDARLLEMFGRLDAREFDTEDVRAFCRLFAGCVRAAQQIMFTKTFMQGRKVSESTFHNEFERLLRADPELEGRLTRRDAVAGGFDDLLHDDVICELKVNPPGAGPTTIEGAIKYLGQPTQYGVGRGSQLSVLVILDQSRKTSPPGVIENYIGWLRPKLHGLDDPQYPTIVGVLVINTNLPVPSGWRRPIPVEDDDGGAPDTAGYLED